MPILARRRITMFDALILVAATAVGFAPIRSTLSIFNLDAPSRSARSHAKAYLVRGVVIMSPILLSWSVADLVLCLRRPRPELRRLARQPGAVAAIAATLWGTLTIAATIARMAVAGKFGITSIPAYAQTTLYSMPTYIGPAVSGAWLALALTGRWRPEPTWLDRLGRGLGTGWLVLVLAQWIRGII